MAAVTQRAHVVDTAPNHEGAHTLFKEDRPRHIDAFISFFGNDTDEARTSDGALFDSLMDQ